MKETRGFVSAKDALAAFEQYQGCFFPHSAAVKIINQLSREDVKPVVYGHWIEINPKKDVEGWIEYDYKCSACDEISWEGHNYCPHCGAKMDEEEDNDLSL